MLHGRIRAVVEGAGCHQPRRPMREPHQVAGLLRGHRQGLFGDDVLVGAKPGFTQLSMVDRARADVNDIDVVSLHQIGIRTRGQRDVVLGGKALSTRGVVAGDRHHRHARQPEQRQRVLVRDPDAGPYHAADDEAGMVDGPSRLGAVIQLVLPAARPGWLRRRSWAV